MCPILFQTTLNYKFIHAHAIDSLKCDTVERLYIVDTIETVRSVLNKERCPDSLYC